MMSSKSLKKTLEGNLSGRRSMRSAEQRFTPFGIVAVCLFATVSPEAAASEVTACVLRHQYEPCGAFSESLVREAMPGLGSAEMEQQEYSKKPRPPKEGSKRRFRMPPSNISSCTYSWPSSMKQKINMPGGKTMEIAKEAEIRLTGIVEYAADAKTEFERTHRTPTAEELKRLDAAVDKKLGEAEAEGKVNASGREVGKSLANSAMSGIRYSEVEGVGDQARWESKSSQLSVLVDSLKFDLVVAVGDDASENLEGAKVLAKAVLAACR